MIGRSEREGNEGCQSRSQQRESGGAFLVLPVTSLVALRSRLGPGRPLISALEYYIMTGSGPPGGITAAQTLLSILTALTAAAMGRRSEAVTALHYVR